MNHLDKAIFIFLIFLVLSIMLLEHLYVVETVNILKVDLSRLHEGFFNQQSIIASQQELILELLKNRNTPSPVSSSLSLQEGVNIANQGSLYSCLPYVIGGVVLILVIVCCLWGRGSMPDSPGGFGSSSVEPTNILANGKSVLNNLTVVGDNVSGLLAEASSALKSVPQTDGYSNMSEAVTHATSVCKGLSKTASNGVTFAENISGGFAEGSNILKDVSQTEGYANMSEAVINTTTAFKGFSKTVSNEATFTENVSGGLAEASTILKDISQTEGYSNLSEAMTTGTVVAKNCLQTMANISGTVKNVSEAGLELSCAGTKAVKSVVDTIGAGVNRVESGLSSCLTSERSQMEILDVPFEVTKDNADVFLTAFGNACNTDLSGFSVVEHGASSMKLVNATTSDQLTIHHEFVVGPYISPPLGPILSGGPALFKDTVERDQEFARLVENFDAETMLNFLDKIA
jgi:hypothetical protein